MAHYREFLGGRLMQLPGVQESTSYPVMEALPIHRTEITP